MGRKVKIISDAFCGVLMLGSLLAFLLIGIFGHVWHPTWVIIPSAALVCGIISVVVNACIRAKGDDGTRPSGSREI